MASSDLNIEEFISAVQARPALWMSKHKQYKNKKVITRLWNEIKSLFPGHEESQLKKKWKNLKDHFKKEVKKFPIIRSGMGGESVSSTWHYYELMTFLKDDVIPEPTGGNLESDHDEDNEGDNDNVSEDMDRMTDMSTTTTSSSLRRKNKTAAEVRDEFLELENKKIKLLEAKYNNKKTNDDMEKDDDYHFFMSLIPQMKNFTNIQKLRIRNKITKIIIDEAEMYTYIPTHSRDLASSSFSRDLNITHSHNLTSSTHTRDLTPTYGYHSTEFDCNNY